MTTSPDTTEGELAFDVHGLAHALGITTNKAAKLIKNGEVPTIRIGRSVRVPKSALIRWMEERA